MASIPSKEEKQKKTLDGSHFYKAKQGSHVDEETVEVVELTPMLFRKAVSAAVTEDALAPLTDSGGHGAAFSMLGMRLQGWGGWARESSWCWTRHENQTVLTFSR